MAKSEVLWQGAPTGGGETLFNMMEDKRKKDIQLGLFKEKSAVEAKHRQAETDASQKFQMMFEGVKQQNDLAKLAEANRISMGAETERGTQMAAFLGGQPEMQKEGPMPSGGRLGPGSPVSPTIPPLAAGAAKDMFVSRLGHQQRMEEARYGHELTQMFESATPEQKASAAAQADSLDAAYGQKHPLGDMLRNMTVGNVSAKELRGHMEKASLEHMKAQEKRDANAFLAERRQALRDSVNKTQVEMASGKLDMAKRKELQDRLLRSMTDATTQIKSKDAIIAAGVASAADMSDARKSIAELNQIHDAAQNALNGLNSMTDADPANQPKNVPPVDDVRVSKAKAVLNRLFPETKSMNDAQLDAFFRDLKDNRKRRKDFQRFEQEYRTPNYTMPRGGVKG